MNTWSVNNCQNVKLEKESNISDELTITSIQNSVTVGTYYLDPYCTSQTGSNSLTTAVGSWVTNSSGKKEYTFYYNVPTSGSLTFNATSTTSNSSYSASMTIQNLYDVTGIIPGSCDYRVNNTAQYACVCDSGTDTWSLIDNKCISNSGRGCTFIQSWNGSSCVPAGVCAGGKIWNSATNQCDAIYTFEPNPNGAFYGRVGGRCDNSGILELYVGGTSSNNPTCIEQNGKFSWNSDLFYDSNIQSLNFGNSFTLGIKKQTDSSQTLKTFYKNYFDILMSNDFNHPLSFELLSNSKYVVAGYQYNVGTQNDILVKSFMPNGTLDTGYASSGILSFDGGPSQNDYNVNTHSDSASNIYTIGSRTDGSSIYKFLIRKFNSSGAAHSVPTYFYDTISGIPKTSFLGSSSLYVFGYADPTSINNMIGAKYDLFTGIAVDLSNTPDFTANTVVDLGNNKLLLAGQKPSDSSFAITTFDMSTETFSSVISYGTGVATSARVITYNGSTEIIIVGSTSSDIYSDTKVVKLNLSLAPLFNRTFIFSGGFSSDDNRSKAVDVFYENINSKIYVVSYVGAHTMKDLGIIGLNIDGSGITGYGNNGNPEGIRRTSVPIQPLSLKPYGNGFIGIGLKFSTPIVFKYDLW
jgi:hypothetical protein